MRLTKIQKVNLKGYKMNKLKTLEEHNTEALKPKVEPKYNNGIACPNCGKELIDSNPYLILTSNPPQTATKCLNCGYQGSRYC